MAFIASIATIVNGLNQSFNQSFNNTGSTRKEISVVVTNGATAQLIPYTFDVTKKQALCLLSDQNITVVTNSSGSPVNTFILLAGVPFVWPQVSGQALDDQAASPAQITTSITALYAANASGTDANFTLNSLET